MFTYNGSFLKFTLLLEDCGLDMNWYVSAGFVCFVTSVIVHSSTFSLLTHRHTLRLALVFKFTHILMIIKDNQLLELSSAILLLDHLISM